MIFPSYSRLVLRSAQSADILNHDFLERNMYKKYSYTLALSATVLVSNNIVLDIIFMYIKNENVEPL